MATVEIPVLTVVPSLTGSFCVATLPWTFDSCEITKIRAKLSSGTGTFNAKIATNDTKDAGWDLSQNIVENIGGLYWHVRADDLEEGTSNSDGDAIEYWYSFTKSLSYSIVLSYSLKLESILTLLLTYTLKYCNLLSFKTTVRSTFAFAPSFVFDIH